jgi:xanthine dehydrogenase molybdopterin-binding subunit B
MQHIAKVVKKDPVQVRLNNMRRDDNVMPQMVKDLKVSPDYDARKEGVDEFNKASCAVFFPMYKIKPVRIVLCCVKVNHCFVPNLV